MTTPILYTFRRCPYAMRARLALVSAGISVELREILLREKPAEMLAVSPKATVPVIISGDSVIDESRDIMDWALNQNDPENWLNSVDLTIVERCETEFKDALDRYKYSNRYAAVDGEEQRDVASGFLRQLETMLATKPFLSGTEIGYTDIATVTFVRQFANVDRAWFDNQKWPHLISWLENFLHSDRFAFIMQKFPLWQSDNPPIYFPEKT